MLDFLEFWWLEIINFFLILLVLTLYVSKKLYKNAKYWPLGLLYCITLIIEIISTYYTVRLINNLFLYHILTVVQFVTILFQFRVIIRNKSYKKWTSVIAIIGTVTFILLTFGVQPLNKYPSYSIIIKYLFFCSLALFYYNELLASTDEFNIVKDPIFWLVSGIVIISFCGIILEGVLAYLLEEDKPLARDVFYICLFLNYLFSVFVVISFALAKKDSS